MQRKIDLSYRDNVLDVGPRIAIDKVLHEVISPKVLEKTPTKSGTLAKARKTKIISDLGKFIGEGYFDPGEAPYAIYVETRRDGSSARYHKGPPTDETTVFHTGAGAAMVRRTVDETLLTVESIIQDVLKGQILSSGGFS